MLLVLSAGFWFVRSLLLLLASYFALNSSSSLLTRKKVIGSAGLEVWLRGERREEEGGRVWSEGFGGLLLVVL